MAERGNETEWSPLLNNIGNFSPTLGQGFRHDERKYRESPTLARITPVQSYGSYNLRSPQQSSYTYSSLANTLSKPSSRTKNMSKLVQQKLLKMTGSTASKNTNFHSSQPGAQQEVGSNQTFFRNEKSVLNIEANSSKSSEKLNGKNGKKIEADQQNLLKNAEECEKKESQHHASELTDVTNVESNSAENQLPCCDHQPNQVCNHSRQNLVSNAQMYMGYQYFPQSFNHIGPGYFSPHLQTRCLESMQLPLSSFSPPGLPMTFTPPVHPQVLPQSSTLYPASSIQAEAWQRQLIPHFPPESLSSEYSQLHRSGMLPYPEHFKQDFHFRNEILDPFHAVSNHASQPRKDHGSVAEVKMPGVMPLSVESHRNSHTSTHQVASNESKSEQPKPKPPTPVTVSPALEDGQLPQCQSKSKTSVLESEQDLKRRKPGLHEVGEQQLQNYEASNQQVLQNIAKHLKTLSERLSPQSLKKKAQSKESLSANPTLSAPNQSDENSMTNNVGSTDHSRNGMPPDAFNGARNQRLLSGSHADCNDTNTSNTHIHKTPWPSGVPSLTDKVPAPPQWKNYCIKQNLENNNCASQPEKQTSVAQKSKSGSLLVEDRQHWTEKLGPQQMKPESGVIADGRESAVASSESSPEIQLRSESDLGQRGKKRARPEDAEMENLQSTEDHVDELKRERHQLMLVNKTLQSLVKSKKEQEEAKELSAIKRISVQNEAIYKALKVFGAVDLIPKEQLVKVLAKCKELLST